MSNSQTSLQVKIYKDRSLKSYQIKSEPKKYKKKRISQETKNTCSNIKFKEGEWRLGCPINIRKRGSTRKLENFEDREQYLNLCIRVPKEVQIALSWQ